jgi:hypothetical protein
MSALDRLEKMLPLIGPAVKRSRFGAGLAKLSDISEFAEETLSNFEACLHVATITRFANRPERVELIESVVVEAEELSRVLLTAQDERDVDKAKALQTDLRKSYEHLFRSLRGHVEVWVNENFLSLKAYAELLTRIPQTTDLGRAMERCCQDAAQIKSARNALNMLQSVDDVCRQREALNVQREALNKISGVGGFLSALAEQRATLADISPEVMEWLVETNALSAFSVQAKL